MTDTDIERELERVSTALHEPRFANQYDQLYAVQQALSWALEPKCFKRPYDMVTGTPADSADCSADLHPQAC